MAKRCASVQNPHMMRFACGSLAALVIATLSACHRDRDMVLDFKGGDSVRLVGQADAFRCDDPKYAGVPKVETAEMLFADGTTISLCRRADAPRLKPPPEIRGMVVSVPAKPPTPASPAFSFPQSTNGP